MVITQHTGEVVKVMGIIMATTKITVIITVTMAAAHHPHDSPQGGPQEARDLHKYGKNVPPVRL